MKYFNIIIMLLSIIGFCSFSASGRADVGVIRSLKRFSTSVWKQETIQSIECKAISGTVFNSVMKRNAIESIETLENNYFEHLFDKMIPDSLADNSFSECYLITYFREGEVYLEYVALCFRNDNSEWCIKYRDRTKEERIQIEHSIIDRDILNPNRGRGVYGDCLVVICLIDKQLQIKQCKVLTTISKDYYQRLSDFFEP